MELATLNITPEQAAAELEQYEESLKTDRNREDLAIAQAYRAARRGLPLIRLSESIKRGGFFENGLPRIGVVRADAKECWVHWTDRWNNPSALLYTEDGDTSANRGALVNQWTVRVPNIDRPAVPNRFSYVYRGHSAPPHIPPKYRPRPRRLPHCHLFWEVESWEIRVPPRDPALIKHLRGDLWYVLAVWDLTDVERFALSGR